MSHKLTAVFFSQARARHELDLLPSAITPLILDICEANGIPIESICTLETYDTWGSRLYSPPPHIINWIRDPKYVITNIINAPTITPENYTELLAIWGDLRKGHSRYRGPEEALDLCRALRRFNEERAINMNLPENKYQIGNYFDKLDEALPIARCRPVNCVGKYCTESDPAVLLATWDSQVKLSRWWRGYRRWHRRGKFRFFQK